MRPNFWAPRKDNTFIPLLQNWVKLNKTYAKKTSHAAFDHSEMSNDAMVCAAAWRTKGWVAMTEHVVDRKYNDTNSTGYGRGDIYLEHGKKAYMFESKLFWLSGKTLYHTKNGQDKLQSAQVQLEKCEAYDCDLYYLGYFVPWYTEATMNDCKNTDRVIEHIKTLGFNIGAYCLLDDTVLDFENQSYFCPAAYIALKKYKPQPYR